MATTRGREVFVNHLVHDQVDYFQADGFTRVTGLTIPDVTLQVFFNNAAQSWPLTDGSSVGDGQVVSGRVYFNEVSGSPGIYNVRWRPNTTGYWRVLLTYGAGEQIMAQDFDVRAETPQIEAGLRASFTRSGC